MRRGQVTVAMKARFQLEKLVSDIRPWNLCVNVKMALFHRSTKDNNTTRTLKATTEHTE